jgi:hypothetical protein
MDGRMDGRTDGRMDGWTDGRTDRRIDLQDCFAAAILAAAAKTHGVAIELTSTTKITNAAIWYYCAALLVLLSFVCEGELVITCAFYHRLNSLFFEDALQKCKTFIFYQAFQNDKILHHEKV